MAGQDQPAALPTAGASSSAEPFVVETFDGLGFRYKPIKEGLQVTELAKDSVASRVLRIGDVITEIEAGKGWVRTTDDSIQLHDLRGEPCAPVTFRLLRGGQQYEKSAFRQHFLDIWTSESGRKLVLDTKWPDCGMAWQDETGQLPSPRVVQAQPPKKAAVLDLS